MRRAYDAGAGCDEDATLIRDGLALEEQLFLCAALAQRRINVQVLDAPRSLAIAAPAPAAAAVALVRGTRGRGRGRPKAAAASARPAVARNQGGATAEAAEWLVVGAICERVQQHCRQAHSDSAVPSQHTLGAVCARLCGVKLMLGEEEGARAELRQRVRLRMAPEAVAAALAPTAAYAAFFGRPE